MKANTAAQEKFLDTERFISYSYNIDNQIGENSCNFFDWITYYEFEGDLQLKMSL